MSLHYALNTSKFLTIPVIYKYKNFYRKGYIKKNDNSNTYSDLLNNVCVELKNSDIANTIFIESWCNDEIFINKIINCEDISSYTNKEVSVLDELNKDKAKVTTALKRLDMISNTYYGLIYLFSKAFFNINPKSKNDVEFFIKENYFDIDLNKKLYYNFFSFIGFPITGKYSWEKNELFTTKDLLIPYSKEQLDFIIRWDTEVLKIMDEKKFSAFFVNLLIEHLNKDLNLINIELSDPRVTSIPGLKKDLITAKNKINTDMQYIGSLIPTESFYYYNKDNFYKILPHSFKPLLDSQFDKLAFSLAEKGLYTIEGFLDKVEINMTSYL